MEPKYNTKVSINVIGMVVGSIIILNLTHNFLGLLAVIIASCNVEFNRNGV